MLVFLVLFDIISTAHYAEVAELVDAPDSKSGDGDIVWVRVPPPVPLKSDDITFQLFNIICINSHGFPIPLLQTPYRVSSNLLYNSAMINHALYMT